MRKRWYPVAAMLVWASLMVAPTVVIAQSARAFRHQNGLLAYAPPTWFLEGCFIAREKKPSYVFGPAREFVKTLGGTTTWLIEDLESERLEQAAAEGESPEYSVFLEAIFLERTEYWVFVIMPHENAQAWFDARRAYHGRKAVDYYGETQSNLERAFSQGLKIKAELRFLIENGDTSLKVPEDEIMRRYKFQPVFDLRTGRWLDSVGKTQ